MSLLLRRIALENFRKFREPRVIEGLTGGLNIVIEDNEAGKSTLLDAVRAALFLKHGSKTALIKSFQPLGDNVAPVVSVDFEVDGAAWSLRKQFLKSAAAELSGPRGRSQGDAAEQALQGLLGFEAGTQGSGFDRGLHGALGMLWVAQMDGLGIEAPGGTLRGLIGAALEGEAGAIVNSAAFDRVRGRIETQYLQYYTGRNASPTARLAAAQARVKNAETALVAAREREQALEAAFTELGNTRRALATLRRELDDDHDAAERAELAARLETARSAAQQLATRKAEASAAAARLATLEDLGQRHALARDRQAAAETRRAATAAQRAKLAEELDKLRSGTNAAQDLLQAAQAARETARAALARARVQEADQRRRTGILAAQDRLAEVTALEAERADLAAKAARAIPGHVFDDLAAMEREVVRHRTLLEADGTRVALIGSPLACDGLTRDGAPLEPGEWTLTRETRIGLPGGGELLLRPSQALAGAQDALDAATARRTELLAQWEVESLAAAQARNDAAREAARAIETLAVRIAAAAPADRDLELAAGPEALRAFLAATPLPPVEGRATSLSVGELETALEEADTAFARTEARLRQAQDDLREAEKADTPLMVEERTATGDFDRSAEELAVLAAHPDFATFGEALAAAREGHAAAAVALEQALTNARAFDEATLLRRLDAVTARRNAAEQRRAELNNRIVRLEAQVESEGGKGLAEQAEVAREEDEAARAALARIEEEAETLRLLRDTLTEAQTEIARTVTGPVAAQAGRYVSRLLPGAEPAFAEDLGLSAIRRAGVDEACEQLSRGTQEQLAMLTRLAFADMLLEEGRPVSLILDDPLVYSDDLRLDAMTDLIVEASQRMQVILLSCRERAFRHVEGNRVRL